MCQLRDEHLEMRPIQVPVKLSQSVPMTVHRSCDNYPDTGGRSTRDRIPTSQAAFASTTALQRLPAHARDPSATPIGHAGRRILVLLARSRHEMHQALAQEFPRDRAVSRCPDAQEIDQCEQLIEVGMLLDQLGSCGQQRRQRDADDFSAR